VNSWGELIRLRWDQIDLKRAVIRLRSGDTKTDEGRVIPMTSTVREALAALPRGMGATPLFRNPATDRPYTPAATSLAFQRACRHAGVDHATLHDLRHTFVTNARRAGIDYFRIMAITGHKTMRVFKRYNLIDEGDLRDAIRRLDGYLADRQMDTYMDTNHLQASNVSTATSGESRGLSHSGRPG
jgi:integrase